MEEKAAIPRRHLPDQEPISKLRDELAACVHKRGLAGVSQCESNNRTGGFLHELPGRKDFMNDRQREYERLIAPIEDRMMRAVWRISRDPHDTEDAFQEALLTVWKRWDRIRTHPNPHALILRICINAAYDLLRRKARREKWLEAAAILEDIPDSSASAIQNISGAEQDAQVLRAIGLLPKNQARAILMHVVEEIPYGDIAAALECREATVRKHVARARTGLRTLLSHLIPAVHKEEGNHA
jgi:RNA polymerase sigma factor (sigma-70 family)